MLKFAHLSRGRIRDPRILKIIEEQRRVNEALIAEWQAEQEQKNAELAAQASSGNYMRLGVAPRYAKGIAHPSVPRSRS